jgi:hypothetical protein
MIVQIFKTESLLLLLSPIIFISKNNRHNSDEPQDGGGGRAIPKHLHHHNSHPKPTKWNLRCWLYLIRSNSNKPLGGGP